jgi:undecaprenyl-diphosphatase
MTTFQSIVYATLHGVAQFVPVSAAAHHKLVSYLFGWPEPPVSLLMAMTIGATLALLVQIRHDWISVLASGIRSLVTWKKPMTIDERMPFFILLGIIPLAVARLYFPPQWLEATQSPLAAAAILAAGSLLLMWGDRRSRQNKRLLDWNWKDALILGFFQTLAAIPTIGLLTPAYSMGLLRNFSREAAWKFTLFILLGLLGLEILQLWPQVQWSGASPGADLSWLSFGAAIAVSTVIGYLTIGAFLNVVQNLALTRIAFYRIVVSGGVAGVFWLRATVLS